MLRVDYQTIFGQEEDDECCWLLVTDGWSGDVMGAATGICWLDPPGMNASLSL
jgi:hypothetical protein